MLPDSNVDDPLIGAKLRYALTHVEDRLLEALAEAGHPQIQLAHFKVFRFPPPDNERPIDLAVRAGITKQAMNYLLTQLEEMGYLERSSSGPAPHRRVSLTRAGWAVARVQRETVLQLEAEWKKRIGNDRFGVFYSVLSELAEGEGPSRAPMDS